MWLRVLGSAAGGGFPQWNCDCAQCVAVRRGSTNCAPRTQSSIAVSADYQRWAIVNASPDIAHQIDAFGALHPSVGRSSPIEAVLLTDAELDHTAGLLVLREQDAIHVHATAHVRDVVSHAPPEGTALLTTLSAYCRVDWHEVAAGASVPMPGGYSYRAFDSPTEKQPRFTGNRHDGHGRNIGYRFTDGASGRSAAVLPTVHELTPALLDELSGCDCVLIDGTCFTDTELIDQGLAGSTSRRMGHEPIDAGSLDKLAALRSGRKIYTHINNTNPILMHDSPQRAAVRAAGVDVAYDLSLIHI